MITTNTTWEQLQKIDSVPPAKQGWRWQSVSHHELACVLMDSLKRNQLDPQEPRLALSKDRREFAITVSVTVPTLPMPEGFCLSVGVINSNTGHKRIRLYGGVITRSDNVTLSDLGGIVHSPSVDIREGLNEGVRYYLTHSVNLTTELHKLRTEHITGALAEHYMMQAGRQKIIPWSRVSVMDRLFFDSERKEWDLFCAFSYANRKSPPINQMPFMVKFKDILRGK